MNIHTLAGILLAERIVSSLFVIFVINKQRKLFRTPILVSKETMRRAIWARRALFGMSFAVLIGNIVPILIDTLTIFADLEGRANPAPIGVAYAVSNATTSVLFALLVWAIYKLSERIELDHKD